MEKTIFVTTEGGMVQNICATEDVVDTKIIIIDFDIGDIDPGNLSMGLDDRPALIYDYMVSSIDDRDIGRFKEIAEELKE